MPSHKLYDRSGSELETNTAKPGSQTLPAMARASAGSYVTVWTHDDGAGNVDIRGQLFSDAGVKIGAEFTVNTATAGVQTDAAVAHLPGGGFVIVWQGQNPDPQGSGMDILFQRFDANGAKLGAETVANSAPGPDQGQPSVAVLANGNFVISWTAPSGVNLTLSEVEARIFGAAGQPLGPQFQVNTITAQRQEASSVTALADGGFAIVWQDGSPQGVQPLPTQSRQDYGTDIAIQIFDAGGNKVGPQRVVDDLTPGLAFSSGEIGRVTATAPVATTLANGTLAVVWADFDGVIKTRILAANGTPLTAVAVSGEAFNQTALPAITSLSDGGYAVSWTVVTRGPPDSSASSVRAAVYNAAGVLQGANFVANTTVAGAQGSSAMLALPGGGFALAWQDGSPASDGIDIRGQHFSFNNGSITDLTFSAVSISQAAPENIAVGRLSAEGALNAVFTYEIIADSTGGGFRIAGERVIVADTLKVAAAEGDNITLQLRATDGQGNSWTETLVVPILRAATADLYVADEQLLVVPPSQSNSVQSPDLLTLAGGRVLLTWNDQATAPNNPPDVIGQIFEADGTPVTAPFVLNTATNGLQLEHDLAALPGGGFVATWTSTQGDGNNNNGVRAQIFDVNGAKVGTEFAVNTTTAGSQQQPSVTVLADGGFFITFTTFDLTEPTAAARGDVRGQFFTAAGAKVGPELAINATTVLQQSTPVAVALADGKVLIAWTDASRTGGDTSLVAIRATLLNADGTTAVPEFLVNTTTQQHQVTPAATALSGGGFVIVWRDTSENSVATTNIFEPADIRGQLYDADGQPVGSEFLINQDSYHAQAEPIVTARPGGGFTVTWQSNSLFEGDESSLSIKARSYNGDGSPAGNEFLVNQYGTGQQSYPVATYTAAGDLVFAWWDLAQRGADGNPLWSISGRALHKVGEVANGDGAANVIAGTEGSDVLDGGAGDDTITGAGGNDVLRGGAGTDILSGGLGDDVYTADADDTITEAAGQGIDEVRTALAAYTLGENLENLTGTGASGQALTGNAAANVLRGGAGADSFAGLAGDDVYHVEAGDSVSEAAGEGVDEVITALGSKTDFAQLYVLPAQVEKLTGTATGDQGVRGNALDNLIVLGAGNDLIVLDDGGNDSVFAGDGHDFLYFGATFTSADAVNGGPGTDTVGLLGDYIITLTGSFQSVERLALYTGSLGDPGGGFDYIVTVQDAAVAPGGELFVTAASLAAGETLVFDGSAETNGRFNVLAGAGGDTLAGGAKADFLFGAAGDDFLYGLAGNDTLRGGTGADTLRGGSGRDIFRYENSAESTSAAYDTIADFKAGGELDKIDLSAIDANSNTAANDSFTFIGTNAAFTGVAGQLRVVQNGANWFVEGDTDGNGAADLVIRIANGGGVTFLAGDFVP